MEHDLTIGSIRKNLFHMAWPLMLGMLFQTAFNIVDTIFVGMLGPKELAAISLTFPVVFVFIAIASGLAIGATSLVAQEIGAKNYKKANNIAEHSLLFALLFGIIIAVLGILFSPFLFSFMGATPSVLALTMSYSNTIFIGFIFLFVGFIAMSLIRAQGNTKTPMKYQLFAVLLNVVLDPIMIFGLLGFPALGLIGAAIATVFSRIIMALLNFAYLLRDKTKIKLRPKDFSLDLSIIKRIVFVGLPASIGQSINSIGMILLTALVGGFGTTAIAAYGIGMRLDSLVLLPIMGLTQAVIAIVGQNYGKKEFNRAIRTVKYSTVFTSGISFLFSTVMILFPAFFFLPFTREHEIISIGTTYLSIVAFGYVFKGIMLTLNAGFMGSGKTFISMLLIAGNWALTLGISWLLIPALGLSGVWFGILSSTVLTAMAAFAVFKSKKWL